MAASFPNPASSGPAQALAVIGHEAAKKQLDEAYDSGRFHHAWLLVGNEGIGKATLAYHAAHMILSSGACRFGRFNPEHPSARLIRAESHPDLFVLRRPADEKTGALKDSIAVEDARKLGPFLRLTSSQGSGRRVAIIDEAHRLGRSGQNAILKLIEEPPSGASVFLTATTVGGLLPTIRSRCRVLPLAPLSPVELETVLARLGASLPTAQAEKAHLLEVANGSAGLALRVMEADILPLFDETLSLLQGLPELDMARLHRLGDLIGKKAETERFRLVAALIVEALRRAVRAAALGQADAAGLAARLAPAGRLDKVLDLWEKTKRTFEMADGANLDNKLAFIKAMTEIRQTAS